MKKVLLAVLLVSGLGGWVWAEKAVQQNVLSTVDGEVITKDELYLALVQLYPQQANETLNRLVNQILISNEAGKRGVQISSGELKKRAEELGITGELSSVVKRIIETSVLAEKMIAAEKKIKVTDGEIKKFFDENRDKLGEPEQVHLRQIFVSDEREANDILLALNAGADFSKMAGVKSQDTASKEKDGDLGFFAKGMLVPEIEKVVFEMKTGEISSVIKTSAGFHIVQVEEKKPAKEAKFNSDMKKRLNRLIFNNKTQQELPGWLDGLRKKADIK